MHKKKHIPKSRISKENRQKALEPPSEENTQRRDPETNVYIPTDAEAAKAKAWVEFCKL